MKLINFNDIEKLEISPMTCYAWAEEMILYKNNAILPPKISMKPYDGVFCNVMPSIINDGSHAYGGIKIVTRYPGHTPSIDGVILLFDAETGEYLAILDGTWITAMRTGAVAAHSIQLFAKKDFSVLGMMGLGNAARATLLVLAELLKDREFHIKLLEYKGQERIFASRFQEYPNLHFSFVQDVHAMVKGSEVVISGATYLPQDVCDDSAFDQGVTVLPIHTLGFTNCDLFFDKIYADDYGHVCHFKNFDKFHQFAEVHDVLVGRSTGRENDAERILVYNIGISMHDVNFASHIYQEFKSKDLLPEIEMRIPEEKFWV